MDQIDQKKLNSKRELSSEKGGQEAEAPAQKKAKIDEEEFSNNESSSSYEDYCAEGFLQDGELSEWPPPIQYSEAESEDEDPTVEEEERNARNAEEPNKDKETKTEELHDEKQKMEMKAEKLHDEEEIKEIQIEESHQEDKNEIKIEVTAKEDPSADVVPNKPTVHVVVADLCSTILAKGLPQSTCAELLKEYPGLANCNVAPPKLNPEVSVKLNNARLAADARMVTQQELAGASMTALGQAVSMLTTTRKEKWDIPQLVRWLGDAVKLTAAIHHEETVSRKALVTPLFSQEFQSVCDSSTTGEFLFGDNLGQRVRDFEELVDQLLPSAVKQQKKMEMKAKYRYNKDRPQQSQLQSSEPQLPRRKAQRPRERFKLKFKRT